MKNENVAKKGLNAQYNGIAGFFFCCFLFLYISQPSSAKQQQEMTKSAVRNLEDVKYDSENKMNLHLRRI